MVGFSRYGKGDLLDMAKKNNKSVKKAVENYEILTGDEEIKRLAEIKLMSDLEEHSALESARAIGKKRGLKEGHKLGLQQCKELGLQQGEKIGIEKGQLRKNKRNCSKTFKKKFFFKRYK